MARRGAYVHSAGSSKQQIPPRGVTANRPSGIGYPPLETPITLVLYPALNRFALRPAAFTRCRIDIAIKFCLEWDWCIWMPFCPTRWLVRGNDTGSLPLKFFEFALLLCGKGMRCWARTERGWFGRHGTTKDETEMEREVTRQMDC